MHNHNVSNAFITKTYYSQLRLITFNSITYTLSNHIKTCNYVLDERLIEYDIDAILFDDQSDFQRVQIVHSKTLGNMLVLDDLQSKYH